MPKKAHLQPANMGPKTLAGMLITANIFQRLGRSMTNAAAEALRNLDAERLHLQMSLSRAEREHADELSEARKEAKSLYQRTAAAIEEMQKSKNNFKAEKPVAVILSPYQHEQLTLHSYCRQRKLKGINIYVARGVYGPVVLTQDAFDGFTRMAPELNIRATTAAPAE